MKTGIRTGGTAVALALLFGGCGSMLVDPDAAAPEAKVAPAAYPPQDGWDESGERSVIPSLPFGFWVLYISHDALGPGWRWVAVEETGRATVEESIRAGSVRETSAGGDLSALRAFFNRAAIEGLPGRNTDGSRHCLDGQPVMPGGGYARIVCRIDGRDRGIILTEGCPVPDELKEPLAALRRIGGFPR